MKIVVLDGGIANPGDLSWDCLKKNISSVIPQYEKGGAKEVIGARQHRTVIDALKQFSEFVDHP